MNHDPTVPPGDHGLAGVRVVITGASSGIGYHAARQLAAAGAHITLPVRSLERGMRAAQAITADSPDAQVLVAQCDLADLSSIRRFAADWQSAHPTGPDILINNAGVLPRTAQRTADGFELTIGTNHLGHFALTGLLLPGLLRAGASGMVRARVVTVTSLAHHVARWHPERWATADPHRRHRPWQAYAESKLANAIFATELQRRLRQRSEATQELDEPAVVSVGVHPGIAVTNVLISDLTTIPRAQPIDGFPVPTQRRERTTRQRMGALIAGRLVPSAAQAARIVVAAAGDRQVMDDRLIAPRGFLQITGEPGLVSPARRVHDRQRGIDLWQASEAATGVSFLGG